MPRLSAVSFQLLDQRCQHPFSFCDLLLQHFVILLVQEVEISGQNQVVLKLAGRAHSDVKKMSKFRCPASAAAFGDVSCNGYGCTAHLTCQAISLRLGERSGCLIQSQSQQMGLFPDFEVPEIAHSVDGIPWLKKMTLHAFYSMICFGKHVRRHGMERFLKRHEGRIKGIISGFDRVLFRGTLRSISYSKGMEIWLSSRGVLMKNFAPYAEQLSNRLKEHARRLAEKHNRPFLCLESSKQSKEDRARDIMKEQGIEKGLICILSCVESCRSYPVRKDWKAKLINLFLRERKCLHLYFYYADPEFGVMHVRLQTWIPFNLQICINGWSDLEQRLRRSRIGYDKRENCFAHIDDMAKAQRFMDQLVERRWAGWLQSWARQVNPLIHPRAGLSLRGYYWTILEGEYATDVLFKDAASLKEVYPALIRHAITNFGCEDILRFLGRRVNTRFNGEIKTELKRREDGVRIKHWIEENWIKMYDKQKSILRIETTINNPRRFKVYRKAMRKRHRVMSWLPMRKGIVDIRRRVELSRAANERYLDALSVVGEPQPSHKLLDPVSKRIVRDGQSYRPIHPISPEDSRLLAAMMQGEFLIHGFRNVDLRTRLEPSTERESIARSKAAARITRKLRLLRAHAVIKKVSGTHYYRLTKIGQLIASTALSFRERDLAVLKAA